MNLKRNTIENLNRHAKSNVIERERYMSAPGVLIKKWRQQKSFQNLNILLTNKDCSDGFYPHITLIFV